ncbi:MAG: DUF5723 family protein [Dysgonomonas sp.]
MKSRYILRPLFFVAVSLLSANGLMAQTATEYFMESSFSRLTLNPAQRPNQGYVTFIAPLVDVYAGVKTNTLNLDNFTFPVDGNRVTFMHKDVTSEQFLKNIKDDNYVSFDTKINIFGVGFYKGDAFWSVDMNIRSHVDANLPKQIFALAKNGFSQDKQTIYNIENTNATGNAYLELGVGYSRPVLNNSLIVGGKVKLLSGIADFDLDAKSLELEAGPDIWRAKSHVVLKGSAPGIKVKKKIDEDDGTEKFDGFEDFEFDGLSSLGFGLGFDLGAVYDLGSTVDVLKGVKVSAALTDIGFMKWNEKNTVILESPETVIIIDPNDYTIHQDGSTSLNDVFEDVLDDLEKAVDLKTQTPKSRTIALRSTLNLGAEYEILSGKLSAGALYSNRFGTYFNSSEFTLSANYRPCSWFAASAGYSFIHSSFDTFGLAMHLAPSKGLRLFLASDYAIPHINPQGAPTTSKALNFQIGISVPIGAKRVL